MKKIKAFIYDANCKWNCLYLKWYIYLRLHHMTLHPLNQFIYTEYMLNSVKMASRGEKY